MADLSVPPKNEDGVTRRYVAVLLSVLSLLLLTVLALNLLLGERALGSVEATRMASAWQQETRGVTYAPPASITRPFKLLRLADRLPEVNTLVLGSSTAMGIAQDQFPSHLRVYNLTLTGNSTASVIADMDYIERHLGGHIRWVVAGLDWSVGMVYQEGGVGAADFSTARISDAYSAKAVPWHKRMADALSWPRVENLAKVLSAAGKSQTPVRSLQHAFFDIAGQPYRCEDGSMARDFDVINRGLCRGFRDDGSWTFANDRRLTPAVAATFAVAAAAPSSKYSKHLCTRGGEPNPEYLRHLGEAAQRFAAKGGQMVALLPPLSPGLEETLLKTPRWKSCLERTKATFHAWAAQYKITLIDAGASERFGCRAREFSDEHHAYPECYRRIISPLFATYSKVP